MNAKWRSGGPQLYKSVTVIEPGGDLGIGKVVHAETKGFLPYVLHWNFRVTSVEHAKVFRLKAWGDIDGQGIWTFAEDGFYTDVTYEWTVRAAKPLLKYFSFLLRPLFAANHNYVMRKGEEGLRRTVEHTDRR